MCDCQEKKIHFFETVFKTTNHPQKPHGHRMKGFWSLTCGAERFPPSTRLGVGLSDWDEQNIPANI